MARIKLDPRPIARDGLAIESTLNRVIDQAEATSSRTVEIVPGEGWWASSGSAC